MAATERMPGVPASQPSFRRLPRAVREQQMLDAAVAVFSRRGYHAASVDEIAEAAGISKPMVYAYLGTKEELFVACLHREGTRLMEAIAAAAGDGLAPDEQLWRGLRAFLGFVAAHRDGWIVLYGQARGQEPFAAVLAQMRARMVEIVSGMFARAGAGARRGSQRDDSAVDDIAVDGVEVDGVEVDGVAVDGAAVMDVTVMGYAVVGAAEALADWMAAHPDEDPDVTATRLMDVVWSGAGAALRGDTWKGHDHPP